MRTLFDQTKIKNVTLKNRFVRSATWERLASADGRLNERLFAIYEDLAKGQVGMIITSYTHVTEHGQPNAGMLGIYDDRGLEDCRTLVRKVHEHGSAILMQIVYGGSQTFNPKAGDSLLGPSSVPEMGTGVVPKEMTKEEIDDMTTAFAAAARRAQKAGFDGVQIHAAHGYFLGQWLNPHHNRRQDEYGGSIENRSRIILEVYDQIRSRCGEDFLVMVKVNSQDFVENGATFDDCRYLCRRLTEKGIDGIEISGGIFATPESLRWSRTGLTKQEDEAYFASYAAQIAEENDVPVILVGGLKSPEVMTRLLAETKIRYFAMSRALMAEPDLVQRWQSGDLQKARCTSCGDCRHPEGNICVLRRDQFF